MVRHYIEIDGQKFWTLFDTGARNSYIVAAPRLYCRRLAAKAGGDQRPASGWLMPASE
jgi:hypothetical protein